MAAQTLPSRLVVLSLPSQLTTEELSAHFSSLDLPITDAKVLQKPDGQSRRVGFVGFSSGEHAQQAKNWYDGTWLRGARIKVEYAQEIHDTPPPRKRQRKLDNTGSTLHRSAPRQIEELHAPGQEAPQEEATQPSTPIGDVQVGSGPAPEEQSDADYMARRQKRVVGAGEKGRLPEGVAHMGASPEDSDTDIAGQNGPDPNVGTDESRLLQTGRLFLRNLSYTVKDQDLRAIFEVYGRVIEARVLKTETGFSKGLAYLAYADPASAVVAFKQHDSKAFQGRVLHMIPCAVASNMDISETTTPAEARFSQKAAKSRSQLAHSENGFNWSTLYMNSNAVLDSVAHRFNISKADLLDAQSSNAGARLALAETHLIQEAKDFLSMHGVNLSSFDSMEGRSPTTLLLKNLPHATKQATIRSLIAPFGSPRRLLLVPSGTLAVAEMQSSSEATRAFKGLAYSKLGTTILYLEKAPAGFWQTETAPQEQKTADTHSQLGIAPGVISSEGSLFVKNIPRETNSENLKAAFEHLPDFLRAEIAIGRDAAPLRKTGYGFVTFRSRASALIARDVMDGVSIGGRVVQVELAKERSNPTEDSTGALDGFSALDGRLVIKNLPFEASRKDLLELMNVYGTVQALRMPRKIGNTLRGFAFVEYTTEREAAAAMAGLKHTHYLGRHLVVYPARRE